MDDDDREDGLPRPRNGAQSDGPRPRSSGHGPGARRDLPPLGERPLPDIEPLNTGDVAGAGKAPRRRKSLWRRGFRLVVRTVLALLLLSVLWVAAYRFVPPPLTATMVADAVAGHGITKEWRPLEAIDPDMARAVIGAEDSRFCTHGGFDVDAMLDAARRNAQGDRRRGGSTISQQTAKNAFLWQGGGYFRKGLEAWFTFLIETLWTKRRIMEVYLNIAETGIGTYGVEAGAQRYFGHGAGTMTRAEAAQLAAVLPSPKTRAGTNPAGFTRRYGNAIRSRIGVVERDGLDACLR